MSSVINGRTPRERLLSRLVIEPDTGCLLWTGEIDRGGYGRVTVSGRRCRVHRLMYEWFAGPIPDGLHLDHLCRVRNCASPAHLEPVTARENSSRGLSGSWRSARITQCPQGHPYDEANTHIYRGARRCRACWREACRHRTDEQRARRAAYMRQRRARKQAA